MTFPTNSTSFLASVTCSLYLQAICKTAQPLTNETITFQLKVPSTTALLGYQKHHMYQDEVQDYIQVEIASLLLRHSPCPLYDAPMHVPE